MADDAAHYEKELMENMDGPSYEDIVIYNIEKEEDRIYFPSNGTDIVDAVNGIPLRTKKGTYDEVRFFRTIDTSGQADKDGIISNSKTEINRSGNYLYFLSPEAYERHLDVKLPESVKNEWHTRNQLMFPDKSRFNKGNYDDIKYNIRKARVEEIEKLQLKTEQTRREIISNNENKARANAEKEENFKWAMNENKKKEKDRINNEKQQSYLIKKREKRARQRMRKKIRSNNVKKA